jgi:hypothetical protein
VATQPRGEGIGGYEEGLREQVDGGWAPGVASRTREPVSFGALARDPLALAESRARHPSSARDESPHENPSYAACGSTSTTAAAAIDAIVLGGAGRDLLAGPPRRAGAGSSGVPADGRSRRDRCDPQPRPARPVRKANRDASAS